MSDNKSGAHRSALLTRLYNHRAMMAPHQRERRTGRLLDECILEIERLNEAIRLTLEENSHQADGDNCTLLRLKQAHAQTNDKPSDSAGK
jgi:hypothetical protein